MILCLILSLISGAALVGAFAPFNIFYLAFLSPAAFLYLCAISKTYKQAFAYGLAFGIGFFTLGVYWVFISIHHFGGANLPLSLLILSLFISFLALFPAIQALVLKYLFLHRSFTVVSVVAFPAIWVIWEWLRELPFNGFPWLFLGYSQLGTPLRGFVPLFGVYGVSLIICFISGTLILILTSSSIKTKFCCSLMIIFLFFIGWLLEFPEWTKPIKQPLTVSLVQGNVAQSDKWQNDQLIHSLNHYLLLTQKNLNSKLIIWPEAAVPTSPQAVGNYLTTVNSLLQKHNNYLIFGTLITNSIPQYFNGLLLIGKGLGQYSKRHLVPFGEYTPLSSLFSWMMDRLNIPMSDLSPGPTQQSLLKVDDLFISPFICYEVGFSQEVLTASKNSNLLIALSDDSWFGDSIALAQHLQISQIRALETGRSMLLATNTGITAFVNAKGEILATAPINKSFVLTSTVIPMTGNTPLMNWYYYPVIIIIILLLALTGLSKRWPRKSM